MNYDCTFQVGGGGGGGRGRRAAAATGGEECRHSYPPHDSRAPQTSHTTRATASTDNTLQAASEYTNKKGINIMFHTFSIWDAHLVTINIEYGTEKKS